MPDNNAMDAIYTDVRGKLIPSKWSVLQDTMIERDEDTGIGSYLEQSDKKSPANLSREELEELTINYLEEKNKDTLSIPLETLRQYHKDELSALDEEMKGVVVYDPQDTQSVPVQDRSEEGEAEEDSGDGDGVSGRTVSISDDVYNALSTMMDDSSRMESEGDAVEVAVRCYAPFMNEDVRGGLRKITQVLVEDDGVDQVVEGTEEEVIRFALTALLQTYNKKMKEELENQGMDRKAQQLDGGDVGGGR